MRKFMCHPVQCTRAKMSRQYKHHVSAVALPERNGANICHPPAAIPNHSKSTEDHPRDTKFLAGDEIWLSKINLLCPRTVFSILLLPVLPKLTLGTPGSTSYKPPVQSRSCLHLVWSSAGLPHKQNCYYSCRAVKGERGPSGRGTAVVTDDDDDGIQRVVVRA